MRRAPGVSMLALTLRSLSLLMPTAQAQDLEQQVAPQVIVPEFTAASVSDMAPAFMLSEQLSADLLALGLDPVDGADLSAAVGDAAMDCADNRGCPSNLWPAFDAPLAVVGRVEAVDGGLDITVMFYEPDREEPLKIVNETVGPGAELEFSAELAETTAALVQARVGFVATQPDPETDPEVDPDPEMEPEVDPVPDSVPDPGHSLPSGTDADPWSEEQRKEMGISKGLYERFLASGNSDPQSWLDENRVRTSSFGMEVGGGLATGSVDRSVTVRLVLQQDEDDDFVELDRYEEDVLIEGRTGQGTLSLWVGLSPRWELGTALVFQYGQKHLVTGWEQVDDDGLIDQAINRPNPAPAAVVIAEPRLRLFPRATGVFKPYAMVLGSMRFYDSYELENTLKVNYQPGRPALQPIGVGAGLGLALDVTPQFSLFFEAPYTRFVQGHETYRSESELMVNQPEAIPGSSDTWRLTAGLGIKF